MSMNTVIHAAIRRDLDRFLRALGALDPGDVARAEHLGRAWDNFDDELTHHHTGEHEIAWVTDGATPQERAAVAEGIPKPVLAVLSGVFGRRYRKEIAPVWNV